MSQGKPTSDDPYVLSRNLAATARLNLQHYIWKEEFGYLLHPSIPVDKENITVADVGTGTGIWLLDLARKLPASTCLEGLDISLDQTPPTGWLPKNVSFRKLNIFYDIPEDLIGKYDIVHVRLLILVIKDNNPVPVLQQVLKLLKPGGYLQWGEIDLSNRKTVKTNPNNSSESLEQLQDDIQKLVRTPFSSWPVTLEKIFEAQGMKNVASYNKWTQEAHLSFVQTNNLLIQEEIINSIAGEKRENLRSLFTRAVVESRQGVAWNIERWITIGQKAKTSA